MNMFIIKLRNNINKSIKSNKFSEKMFIKVGHTNKLYRVVCNKMQMNPENLVVIYVNPKDTIIRR